MLGEAISLALAAVASIFTSIAETIGFTAGTLTIMSYVKAGLKRLVSYLDVFKPGFSYR